MEEPKPTELTVEDLNYFDELVERPTEKVDIAQKDESSTTEGINTTQVDEELDLPDWYRPWMKTRVGWLNGVPQRPLTKADYPSRGRWVGGPYR